MRFLILSLFALSAAASAQPCTTSWINASGGAWSNGANWSDGVPDAADDACITLDGIYQITAPPIAVRSLRLGAATGTQTLVSSTGLAFGTTGTINSNGVLRWSGGFLEAGTLVNRGGIDIQVTAGVEHGVRGAGTLLRNEGTILFSNPLFYLEDEGRFENAGSVITARGGIIPRGIPGTLVFEPGSTWEGDTRVEGVTFLNSGTWTIPSPGQLRLFESEDHVHRDATFILPEITSSVLLAGHPTFEGTIRVLGEGRIENIGDFRTGPGGAVINTEGKVEWVQGTFTEGDLAIRGLLEFTGRRASTIGAGATLRTAGIVQTRTGGGIELEAGAQIINTGDWQILTAGNLLSAGGGRFVNEGTYRLLGANENRVQAGIEFVNRGVLGAASGSLRFPSGLAHENGVITGDGEIAFPDGANVSPFEGDVEPGTDADRYAVLAWGGDFEPGDAAILRMEVSPSTAQDQLVVSGDAVLAGELEVTFPDGAPPAGATYTLLTAESVSGSFEFLKVPDGATIDITPTSVVLRIGDSEPPPPKLVLEVMPHDAPLVFVQGKGGRFAFDVRLTNKDTAPYTLDIWTVATRGSKTYGPFLQRTISVGADGTVERRYRQTVPSKAPLGTYTYTVSVGTYPDADASESFPIEVIAGDALVVADEDAWAKAGDEPVGAEVLALGAPAPNPSRGDGSVAVDVPAGEAYALTLHDALGREVARLGDGTGPVGTVRLGGMDLAPGVYMVRLVSDAQVLTRRWVVTR